VARRVFNNITEVKSLNKKGAVYVAQIREVRNTYKIFRRQIIREKYTGLLEECEDNIKLNLNQMCMLVLAVHMVLTIVILGTLW
jgi:hypothetical protein